MLTDALHKNHKDLIFGETSDNDVYFIVCEFQKDGKERAKVVHGEVEKCDFVQDVVFWMALQSGAGKWADSF